MDAVIKVGGSLAQTPAVLRALCVELCQIAKEYAFVVVPGGARFADAVREFDKKYALPPVVAHRMAILAMDQYGLVLSHLIPESCCLNGFKEVTSIREAKKVPVFLPSKLMFHDDSLEASWDVTSDSIAAYIAHRLQAKRVILVTDVNGVFTKDPKKFVDAKLMSEVSVRELLSYAERTSVDKFLPKYLSKNPIDCYVVNGKHPERIRAVLSGRKTICTRVVADACV
ncbi:hypothetical protein MUP38_00470 [Candidatus Bathyarchaeota archaeon]|nr:hypothetical protein [Candidatus Bathyarchaeota archaeon]